jgi:hypothetical protein
MVVTWFVVEQALGDRLGDAANLLVAGTAACAAFAVSLGALWNRVAREQVAYARLMVTRSRAEG